MSMGKKKNESTLSGHDVAVKVLYHCVHAATITGGCGRGFRCTTYSK